MKKLIVLISLISLIGCAVPLTNTKPTVPKNKPAPEFKITTEERWMSASVGAIMLGGSIFLMAYPSGEAEYSVGFMLPLGAMLMGVGIFAGD